MSRGFNSINSLNNSSNSNRSQPLLRVALLNSHSPLQLLTLHLKQQQQLLLRPVKCRLNSQLPLLPMNSPHLKIFVACISRLLYIVLTLVQLHTHQRTEYFSHVLCVECIITCNCEQKYNMLFKFHT